MRKITFFIAGLISLAPIAGFTQELRPRTSGEDRFWKKADAVVRNAISHTPGNGWEVFSETIDDSGFQPDKTRAEDNGPYSYVYEITFVLNPQILKAQLDSVAQRIATAPERADELVRQMERISADAQCRIVMIVNSNYSALGFCAGKPSFPTYPATMAAVRVPAGVSCDAETMLLIGKFSRPQTDMLDGQSGTVSVNGILTGGGAFTLHNVEIKFRATPAVADYFTRKTDIAGLAALVGTQLQ
ncbi:hypothetical protein [Chitinophaga rhizosphaerae]|uniref:hypothetical protein n=1 Tax=Chitinophaga rhizosphaerae TaxID=1864947 RepID=UPI000F8090FD|nr:hypothetical protein [Chitinophaga rhizosphaerae]